MREDSATHPVCGGGGGSVQLGLPQHKLAMIMCRSVSICLLQHTHQVTGWQVLKPVQLVGCSGEDMQQHTQACTNRSVWVRLGVGWIGCEAALGGVGGVGTSRGSPGTMGCYEGSV